MTTMKQILTALLLGAVLWAAAPAPTQAQTVANTVTASAAIDASSTRFAVSSTANITPSATANSTWLYWPQSNELMRVLSVPVSGTVVVRRGDFHTRGMAIASAATAIIITSPLAVIDYDPAGACTRGSGLAGFSPVINPVSGTVWVCRSSLWQGTVLTTVTYGSLAPFTP
jgi:hypothetical protein